MNVKITKEQHEYLCALGYNEYLFGSQLHNIATKDSDFDYVRVIQDSFYDKFKTLASYLPNIHSWQFDGGNVQYVWMTERQFYHNLFSGDGNMIADIVLLSGKFDDSLFLCKTYKIIKGYLGVAKRDLKLHGNLDKKKFHALRSMYMAECLMNNIVPTVRNIQYLKGNVLPSKQELWDKEVVLRDRLNLMLNNKELAMYPLFIEQNSLAQVMNQTNNTIEFKY